MVNSGEDHLGCQCTAEWEGPHCEYAVGTLPTTPPDTTVITSVSTTTTPTPGVSTTPVTTTTMTSTTTTVVETTSSSNAGQVVAPTIKPNDVTDTSNDDSMKPVQSNNVVVSNDTGNSGMSRAGVLLVTIFVLAFVGGIFYITFSIQHEKRELISARRRRRHASQNQMEQDGIIEDVRLQDVELESDQGEFL